MEEKLLDNAVHQNNNNSIVPSTIDKAAVVESIEKSINSDRIMDRNVTLSDYSNNCSNEFYNTTTTITTTSTSATSIHSTSNSHDLNEVVCNDDPDKNDKQTNGFAKAIESGMMNNGKSKRNDDQLNGTHSTDFVDEKLTKKICNNSTKTSTSTNSKPNGDSVNPSRNLLYRILLILSYYN